MIVFRAKNVLLDGKPERVLFSVREEINAYVTEKGLKADEEIGVINVVAEQANAANAVNKNVTLKLPDNITIIGNKDIDEEKGKNKISAFEEDYDYNLISNLWKVTSIRIPSSVTTIKAGFFKMFKGLKEIIFEEPSNIEKIYPRAFAECPCLEKIVIPANANGKKVEIGVYAFVECEKLKSINLPNNSEISLFETDSLTVEPLRELTEELVSQMRF